MIVNLLEERAKSTPNRPYLIFEDETYSCADIWDRAAQFRAYLAQRNILRGARVVLLMDNGPRFFAAFFGAQLQAAIPVPLSPKSPKERIDSIITDCEAELIVLDEEPPASGPDAFAFSEMARALVVSMREVEAFGPVARQPVTPHPIAFVQYTSGSTGPAKGAAISQRALFINIEGFMKRLAVSSESDVLSSMMPLFHDMGLVCFGLGSLYTGAPLVLYRQQALNFYNWLEGIARYRVTITGGPNMFLHLANRLVRDPSQYDLSSLRAFICGSEPISPTVVRAFEDRYRVHGKVKPAYGLAEITLCATITGPDESYRILDDRVISCGKPLEGVRIAIQTSHGEVTQAPFVSGEVLIATPSLMDGYLRRPDLTQQALHGDWYLSGDVGFVDEDGCLYISGRKKNLIIRGGEKIAPTDLESIAALDGEVASCAVVGVDEADGALQSVVLVVEVDRAMRAKPDALSALAKRICASARRRIGYAPDRIAFVAKGRIPVTLNGKIQHAALKAQLECGGLSGGVVLHTAELSV